MASTERGKDGSPPALKSASQLSIGFPERSNSQLNKPPFPSCTGPPASDKNLPTFDQCCVGLFCVDHDKLLTARLKNKGLYVPNFPIRATESWYEIAERSIDCILQSKQLKPTNVVMPEQLVDITRIQLPKQYPHYLTRVTFVLAVKHEGHSCQSKPDDLYTWMSFDEIYQSDTLWGIEPVELFRVYRNFSFELKLGRSPSWPLATNEYDQRDACKYLLTPGSRYLKEKELLLSAKFKLEEVQKLLNEFVMQCFPSVVMTYHSFKTFMNKVGWVNDEEILYKMVFRSFTVSVANHNLTVGTRSLPYLTFDELIVGLAAMEERADHRANCLRLRLSYIFNFYDADQDGKLATNELNQMVLDIKKRPMTEPSTDIIRQLSSHPNSSSEIEGTVGEILRRAGTLYLGTEQNQPPQFITYEQFRKFADLEQHSSWIAELTETLFRSNISTIDVASVKFDYRFEMDQTNVLKAQAVMDHYEEPCEQCYEVHFNMCSHGIKIDEHGLIRSTIKFDLSPYYKDTSFLQELDVTEDQFSKINAELRRLSFIAINRTAEESSMEKLRQTNIEIVDNVRKILKMAKEIIKKEPLIIRCTGPCFIVSELWSNIFNLHALLSTIARMSPFVNPVNLIFLGNYVDPTSSLGVESLLQLLCYKILVPHRIYLLRGSNEFLSPDSKNCFHKECQNMYGADVLQTIYEIFAFLPLMAVVDDRLFLSKSGIPHANKPLSKIESFNPKQKNPIVKLDEELNHIMLSKPLRKSDISLSTINQQQRSLEDKKITKKLSPKKFKTKKKKKKTANSSHKSSLTKKSSKSKKVTKKSRKTTNSKMKRSKSRQHSRSESIKCKHSVGEISHLSQTWNLGFTSVNLKKFLRINNFSHFIRSEHLQQPRPTPMISCRETMITLMGIGQPSDIGKPIKTNGTVALADRYKIRIIRLGHGSKIH